jgi:hypothetical protein
MKLPNVLDTFELPAHKMKVATCIGPSYFLMPPVKMASDVRSGFRPHNNEASDIVIPIFNSLNFAQPALSSVGTSREAHAPRHKTHTPTHISAVAASDRIAGAIQKYS